MCVCVCIVFLFLKIVNGLFYFPDGIYMQVQPGPQIPCLMNLLHIQNLQIENLVLLIDTPCLWSSASLD